MVDVLQYTIGWVCAILPELVAARCFLDDVHDSSDLELPANDNNTYVLGNIKKHNVVIAALPTGEYGTNSAASVARDLIRTFKNVRVGLMVGIAGGAPTEEHDIRLGDIVVSVPTAEKGGVYQYDYGKAIAGEFIATGHLNAPPRSLLGAITELRAVSEIDGSRIAEAVEQVLQDHKRLRSYKRPAVDRLYKTGEDALVDRFARDEKDAVLVHYGLIASGNSLIKDAIIRDRLAKQQGILCFEMEAAGLMNQLPFLVIRGICDYSDVHKNKDWQGYAAMTAAAYAHMLLKRLAPVKVDSETALSEIKDSLQHVTTELNRLQIDAEHQVQDLQWDKILNWLHAPDPSIDYNRALSLRHEGTGAWLLQHESFKAFEQGRQPCIWLHGISGCGKTVLSSTVIDHLRNERTVLFFYFDIQDVRKQKLDGMLRSLLEQCGSEVETQALYVSSKRHSPTIAQMRLCLIDISKRRKLTVVLDALDECANDDRAQLLLCTQDLAVHMSVLLTSREESDIQSSLQTWLSPAGQLKIASEIVDADIRAYLQFQLLHGTDGMNRWQDRQDVRQEIETRLMEKASGMFRYVACQIDILRHCMDQRQVFKALSNLPQGLNETYALMLDRIPIEHQSDAIRLLQFLAYGQRPLYIDEAVDALAVDCENQSFTANDRMPIPLEIAKYCGSLTAVVSQATRPGEWFSLAAISANEFANEWMTGPPKLVIQLAHPSVREYLCSSHLREQFRHSFEISMASRRIAEVCLLYLINTWPREWELRHNLEDYAMEHWLLHAHDAGEDTITPLSMRFLERTEVLIYWLHALGVDEDVLYEFESFNGVRRSTLPLQFYFASSGGLVSCVRSLLEKGADVNEGLQGRSPLIAAATSDRKEVVEMLLDAGAAIDYQEYSGSTALWAAARKSHGEVVALLLSRGAKPNIDLEDGNTVLHGASGHGLTEIVELLLKSGADINRINNAGWTPLMSAAISDNRPTIRLLLEAGAGVDHVDAFGMTAFLLAACCDVPQSLRLLKEAGSDASQVDKRGISACMHALSCGHDKTLAFLQQDDGCNLFGLDALGRSALHLAVWHESDRGVLLSLDAGLDINLTDRHGWTPLHWASYRHAGSKVRLLLSHDADLQLQDPQGWTAARLWAFTEDRPGHQTHDDLSFGPVISSWRGARSAGRWTSANCAWCRQRILEWRYNCMICTRYDLCFRCIRDAKDLHHHDCFRGLLATDTFDDKSGRVLEGFADEFTFKIDTLSGIMEDQKA